MRVIAGTAKGRRLYSPVGDIARPTTDRVKESMFAILQPYLQEADVLDLYAGSGALGIEALSRGANSVVFVDKDRKCAEIIKKNIVLTNFNDKSEIKVCDFGKALDDFWKAHIEFDLIIMDPPYAVDWWIDAADYCQTNGVLKTGGIIMLERKAKGNVNDIDGLECKLVRKYGDTELIVFKRTSL